MKNDLKSQQKNITNTIQNMKILKRIAQLQLLFITITATVNSQPTDNVVAYYPFIGNANDVTVNEKNATVTGATLTTDRLGKVKAAYTFNGSSNLIKLPTNLALSNTAFCLSFWFKSLGNGNYNAQTLLDLRGQYNIAVSFYSNHPTNPNAVSFYIANNSGYIYCWSPNNTIQAGVWYHVVANYGNNTMQLFVNGVLLDTKTQTPPSAVTGYYNNTLGKDYNLNLNRAWFYGSMDEVLIYKRSLTSAEILALYNRGLTTSEFSEIFAPISIQYTYNALGARLSRGKLITLKSASFIATRDSANNNMVINDQNEIFEDSLGQQKVIIYPNPTRGQLKIEIKGYEQTSTIVYLYDLSGKLLLNKKQFDSTIPLDLSSFTNGTYILKIVMGDKTSEWKILKE